MRLQPRDRQRPKSWEYGPEFLQQGVLHLDRRRRGMVPAMESQLEQQRFEAARLRISLGHGRKGAYLVTCPTMVGTDLAYVNHYPLYFLCGGGIVIMMCIQ